MNIDHALWRQLLSRLATALDLPPAEREPWLDRLDASPEAKEALRRLLADREHIERNDFLAVLPALGTIPGATDEPPLRLQAGQVVGAYQLVRELGCGGMGAVWLANRNDGQLRRQVALKIPHAGPGQALLAERLQRERDILAALEHPNIARLYDVGLTAQGLPFLVLEYVEGEALGAYCQARRLGLLPRLQLFLQVLRAVQYAHSMLVLHRDLKPGNILVTPAGDVKLLDFGIAKLLTGREIHETALTCQHGRPLTPSYAAPEQIAGRPLGTGTDVYALGVVLYELLTGRRPYRLQRGTAAELEEAILSAEPLRPSETWAEPDETFGATPRQMRQALRGDLDVIVLTALQKQPQRRYATVDAFAEDLHRHLSHQPILARPASRWYRARKFVARHALAVGAATAILASLSLGLALALWQARETRMEAAKATAIKDFLLGLFEASNVEQADAQLKRQQSVQALLEQSAVALQTGLGDQPQVQSELQGVVGRLLHDLALTNAAVALRQRRADLLADRHAPVAERVDALRELAESLDQRGDQQAALGQLQQALDLCLPLAGDPPQACLIAQLKRGQWAERSYEVTIAKAYVEPAARALLARSARSTEAAAALAALGELQGLQNRPEEAHALYAQAMAIRTELWGADSVRLARERYAIGINLWAERRYRQAEEQLHHALQIFTKALGREHITTALVELKHARLRFWIYGEGQPEVQHAVGVIGRHAAEIPPDRVFEARLAEIETLLFDGRLGEAGRAIQAAMDLPHAGDDAVNSADRLLGWYLQTTGQYDAARERLRALRDRLLQKFPASHPYVADVDDRLARADLAEGRLDRAAAAFERVLLSQDAREDAFGSIKHRAANGQALVDLERGRPELAWPVVAANYEAARKTPREEQHRVTFIAIHEQMGRVLAGQGRPAEALPYFEAVIAAWETGYAHNPELARARTRYAQCLLALRQFAPARRQLALARQALQIEPLAAPRYRRALEKATEQLARLDPPAP